MKTLKHSEFTVKLSVLLVYLDSKAHIRCLENYNVFLSVEILQIKSSSMTEIEITETIFIELWFLGFLSPSGLFINERMFAKNR